MNVVVYSKANCPQCVIVKSDLKAKGIDFTEVRVDQDPAAREFLIAKGHRSAPVVYVDGVHTNPEAIVHNDMID